CLVAAAVAAAGVAVGADITSSTSNTPGDGKNTVSDNEKAIGSSQNRPTTATSEGSATEEDFGKLTEMVGPASIQKLTSVAEDLKRRGSVDERTSTMKGVRLFVANPDL
ncbi:hypothetical protein KEM54_003569, partial [Ascosphaera aggregata]